MIRWIVAGIVNATVVLSTAHGEDYNPPVPSSTNPAIQSLITLENIQLIDDELAGLKKELAELRKEMERQRDIPKPLPRRSSIVVSVPVVTPVVEDIVELPVWLWEETRGGNYPQAP